jgi:hypothetical protein
MSKIRSLFTTICFALLALTYHYWWQPAPVTKSMSDADWILKAQRGYFSHDHDPESWDFRAKTLPGLGLVDNITFSTDGTGEGQPQKDIPRTQWHRFVRFVQHLNEVDSENKQYKIFYLVRHGQGIHNVKEAEAGREEWDVGCAGVIVLLTLLIQHLSAVGRKYLATVLLHGSMQNSRPQGNNRPET